jgi:hypothetical protein
MPFCRMEEADVGFSYIVQTHSCGVWSLRKDRKSHWAYQSNLGQSRTVWGQAVGPMSPAGWVAVNFYTWKIHLDSTDWPHVGISRNQTDHDTVFSSSSSWPSQLIFCNCSFSFGIIKTQPK